MTPIFFFRFILVGLKQASMLNFTLLGCQELVKKFVVVGGGGWWWVVVVVVGVETDFRVQLGTP